MRYGWPLFTSLLLIALWPATGVAGDRDALKKRFFEEAPRRWEEVRDLSRQLQGEVNFSDYRWEGDKKTLGWKWRYQIAQNGQCRLAIIRGYSPSGTDNPRPRATVANSKYAFTLSERNSNAGWILGDLELFKASKKKGIDRSEMDKDIFETACANLVVNKIALPKMVASKNFRLKKIEKRQDGQAELVSLTFDYDKEDKMLGPFSGTITLDPASFWVVKTADLRCDIGTRNDRTEHLENTYSISPRGIPIPQMTSVRINIKQFVDEEKWEYSLREQADVPEHEFSLSAFGLPEPKGAEIPRPSRKDSLREDTPIGIEPKGAEIPRPSRSRYYLWFTLGGLALIAFAIFAIRWAKRWRAVTPSQSK